MPGNLKHGAILYITGDNPDQADLTDAWNLSKLAGLPVATLFNEPVQPLFGLEEDPLIAYTFDKYLKSGNPTWPLLFPMVKGVRAAMTTIQQATHNVINKFVVFGNSKRGWTAWLAGATGDSRIVGIAPTSFQLLNISAQLYHQIKLWEHYSPMFEPYVKAGLLPPKHGARFEKLIQMIDPYSMIATLHCPVLDVRGSNDPFWAVDSHNFYASKLPRKNWSLVLANEGHDFKNQVPYFQAVASFARMCLLPSKGIYAQQWPNLWARTEKNQVVIHSSIRPEELRLFRATSSNGDFSHSKWNLSGFVSPSEYGDIFKYTVDLPSVQSGFGAWFVVAKYVLVEGGLAEPFEITTPIQLELPSKVLSEKTPDLKPAKIN